MGAALSTPRLAVPPLALVALYALSARVTLPFEPDDPATATRAFVISFGDLAIPAAIFASRLAGPALPALLVATLPLTAPEIQVSETLETGFGLGNVLMLAMVGALSVYVRRADFLSRSLGAAPAARALLPVAAVYSALSFGIASPDIAASLSIGSGTFEFAAVALALFVLADADRPPWRGFAALAGAIGLLLAIMAMGVLTLLIGHGGRTLGVGPFWITARDWLGFLTAMLLAATLARAWRDALFRPERPGSVSGAFALVAVCALFLMFRYHFAVIGAPGFALLVAAPPAALYLACALAGYRAGARGIAAAAVLTLTAGLAGQLVLSLLPPDTGRTAVLAAGYVASEARISAGLRVADTPLPPLVLTSACLAACGAGLRRRVEALRRASETPTS